MNKGMTAIELSVIIGIIISVSLLVFILTPLIAKEFRFIEEKVDERENTCRGSVDARAKKVGFEGITERIFKEPWFIYCRTIEKDLGKVENGVKVVKKDELKQQISHHLQRCWWQFAEGRYPYTVSMLADKNIISFDTFRSRGDYISKCYDLSIPQIVDEQGNNVEKVYVNEVIEHMQSPENRRSDKYLPYDYITKYEDKPGRLWFFEDKIESFHTYSIYYSDPNWQDENTETGYNGIYFIEYGRIPKTFKVDWQALYFTKEHGISAAAGCVVGTSIGGTVGAFLFGIGAIPAGGLGCAVGGALGLGWQTLDAGKLFFLECETGEDCPAMVVKS
ncbi:MAG: hypothetical protein QW331_02550 [Candidatus Woesearchaeota archaeon]